MKKKSVFNGIILLVIITLICIAVTVTFALLAGAADVELFNFKNLNLSNMIPILIVGGIISCFIIGVAVLFFGRTVFFKLKDFFSENDKKEDRGNEK